MCKKNAKGCIGWRRFYRWRPKKGIQRESSRSFAVMEKFAGYGFNRSHAYAYSAFWLFNLPILKHFPDIFYQVMLNYSSRDYILDALEMGFELAPLFYQ